MFDAKAIEPAAFAILATGAIAVASVALTFWFFLRRARDRAKGFNSYNSARPTAQESGAGWRQEDQVRSGDDDRELPSILGVISKR